MQRIYRIVLFLLLIGTSTATINKAQSQPVNVNFQVFYNSLKPYGRWVNNPTYGQVWISNQSGFTPYGTGGHWAYTNYGWTWVSDYDWGWAPFHYGRWAYEPAEGWLWVPGYDWAPAWVAWRGSGDYYGWAPLQPGLNIGVDVSFGNSIPADRWTFAPRQYITSPYISRYYVPHTNNVTIIKNTTVVNNITVNNNVHYVAGPRKTDVERANHTTVRTYNVANSSRPGKTVVNNNTINIYKPVINNNKTVVNNHTTVNKNSNNTTVKNASTNNTAVTKNSNNNAVKNTTVNKNSNNVTNNKTAVHNNTNNKQAAAKKKARRTAQQQRRSQANNANINRANTNNKPQNNQNNAPANNQQQVQPNNNSNATPPQHNNKPAVQKNPNQNAGNQKNKNQPGNNR